MTRTLSAVLVTLGDPGQLTGGYLFHRRLAELAPAHNARLEFVSFPRRVFPVAVADAPRVIGAIERHEPDVVVLDSIAATYMALQAPRRPMLGMLHQPPGGIDYGPLRTRTQALLDRLAYRYLARLLVASDSLADEMRRDPRLARRVHVVPPGRDVATEVAPVATDVRAGKQTALLCVGNWVDRKGTLSLLDAFASIEPQLAMLHLVGDTAAEPRYARRVWARLAYADLRGRVVVHGPLSVAEVAGMYMAADVFVLASLKEPYGTVYGEAMAFGLPVVGWRAGNLPYLAEDEREGLIVPPGDVGGLAAALRRLATDADLRRRLGANARTRALQRPTWDDVARLFFGHLRHVAEFGS
jgi:glycosyltransferase involved in cell wall biosynthesis